MKSPCRNCDPQKDKELCAEECLEIKLYQEAIKRNGLTMEPVKGCYICHTQTMHGDDYCDECRKLIGRPASFALKRSSVCTGPKTAYQKNHIYPRRYTFVGSGKLRSKCEYCDKVIELGCEKLVRQTSGKVKYAHIDCAKSDEARNVRILKRKLVHNKYHYEVIYDNGVKK